jgi:hypothetical protein
MRRLIDFSEGVFGLAEKYGKTYHFAKKITFPKILKGRRQKNDCEKG